MATNAFVVGIIGHEYLEGEGEEEFCRGFLNSHDFDRPTLQTIHNNLGLPSLKTPQKEDFVKAISKACVGSKDVKQEIIEQAIKKNKKWMAFRLVGEEKVTPRRLQDPFELVGKQGDPNWYGPVKCSFDEDAQWYIRVLFVTHHDYVENEKGDIKRVLVRWICFARATDDVVSLHWQGFSVPETDDLDEARADQFGYYNHIPEFIDELRAILRTDLDPVDLHDIILNTMWDEYRYDYDNYRWKDRRIRAYGQNMAFSASSGRIFDTTDFGGIHKLASSIRHSLKEEFHDTFKIEISDDRKFDEAILRTLIKELGTLSYDFSLDKADGERLFRAHTYFGFREQTNTRDRFQHMNLSLQYGHHLDQLEFILNHIS